jgi:hypothetical protein
VSVAYKILSLLVLLLGAFIFGAAVGARHVQLRWDLADAQHRIEYARVLADESRKVYEAENKHRKEMDRIKLVHMRELENVKTQHTAVVAALRTGGLRLSVPTTGCSSSSAISGFAASATGTSGPPRAELSATDGEFFINLAADADEVVAQLNACIAIVKQDRETK